MTKNHPYNKDMPIWLRITGSRDRKPEVKKALSPNTKKVAQYKDGVLIAKYVSIVEASNATGIQEAGIGRSARGSQGKSGGFEWKYI